MSGETPKKTRTTTQVGTLSCRSESEFHRLRQGRRGTGSSAAPPPASVRLSELPVSEPTRCHSRLGSRRDVTRRIPLSIDPVTQA